MLSNLHRILAPGGSFICVSRGSPETRLLYLAHPSLKWLVETLKVKKQRSADDMFDRVDQEPFYYIYICEKKY